MTKSKSTGINWNVLIISLIVVYAVGFIGSLFTSPNTGTEWYQSVKPSLTPPSIVFPIVWNALFFLIGISLYLAWTNTDKKGKKMVALVFAINFALNILWSVFYFGLKNPVLASVEILFLIASIILMITTTYKINRKSSWLLWPYLIWVCFATILSFMSI